MYGIGQLIQHPQQLHQLPWQWVEANVKHSIKPAEIGKVSHDVWLGQKNLKEIESNKKPKEKSDEKREREKTKPKQEKSKKVEREKEV
jgi:hypothetical protein